MRRTRRTLWLPGKQLVTGILAFLLLFTSFSAAQAGDPPKPEPAASSGPSALCLPGIYASDPGDCSPLGASAYLTQMASQGITFPLTDLPADPPDPNLIYSDIRYGLVRTRNAPVYGSAEDALNNNPASAVGRISSPFSYISYTDEMVVDGRRVYMIGGGQWMTAVDIVRIGAVPRFQGVQLTSTPTHKFGWILTYLAQGEVISKRTPGLQNKDYTGHVFQNHEVVQVYSQQQVGDVMWYMIGPDEWLPDNVLGLVYPDPNPPQGVTGDRWIEVNLYEQTLSVYDHRQLVFATLIASGLEPLWTRPGLFQVKQKLLTTPMRGSFASDNSDAYYLEDVPWTMYFDHARALHGAYWRAQLGFPQSHGCVNLSVGDAHWLFDWAKDGEWVYVWDPSGKTPTDPKFYSDGGA